MLVISHDKQNEHHNRKQKQEKYRSARYDKRPVEYNFFTAVKS